jgi:hypothetical protein
MEPNVGPTGEFGTILELEAALQPLLTVARCVGVSRGHTVEVSVSGEPECSADGVNQRVVWPRVEGFRAALARSGRCHHSMSLGMSHCRHFQASSHTLSRHPLTHHDEGLRRGARNLAHLGQPRSLLALGVVSQRGSPGLDISLVFGPIQSST